MNAFSFLLTLNYTLHFFGGISQIRLGSIVGAVHAIDIWSLVVRETQDTLAVIGCQLKEGDDAASAALRDTDAVEIRFLSGVEGKRKHGNLIVIGDLNTYSASEEAYVTLTDSTSGTPGWLRDPIGRPGDWHSNRAFADIHTQSTRISQVDGGIGGGLQDRFDFVLVSPVLLSHVVPGSYTTFGNDGRHFQDSVDHFPNSAVDPQTAHALYVASDHLPVFVDLVFSKGTAEVEEGKGASAEMNLSSWER